MKLFAATVTLILLFLSLACTESWSAGTLARIYIDHGAFGLRPYAQQQLQYRAPM